MAWKLTLGFPTSLVIGIAVQWQAIIIQSSDLIYWHVNATQFSLHIKNFQKFCEQYICFPLSAGNSLNLLERKHELATLT